MRSELELARLAEDGVGESPFWAEEEQALYWVDIVRKRVQRLEPASGKHDHWTVPDFPTAIALRQKGGAVLVLAGGVYLFDFQGAPELFCRPETEWPGNRLNEAKCDSKGRLWVGSMQSNLNSDGSSKEMTQQSGALYRVDPDGTATQWSENELGISNTMAWTADGSTFYFGDTLAQTIFAFDFELEAGVVSNRRLFAVTKEHGFPDGSCIDEEGYIWNARFAGGCLLRYAPDGSIDRVVDLPVSNPTSCTFGGPDRRILFVTSARFNLTEARLRAEPREGALLALDVGVGGPPDHYFAG